MSIHTIPYEWEISKREYQRDKSLIEIFEHHAHCEPYKIALEWGSRLFTYRELNQRANQLAWYLKEKGVGLGTPVALCLARSPLFIISLLGICKAGGCYIPVDPSYPKERLEFMIHDSQAPVLITEEQLAETFQWYSGQTVVMDPECASIAKFSDSNPALITEGSNCLYIMYTSGSTGQPKGCEVLHRGIHRLLKNTDWIEFLPSDRVAQISNVSFDASTFEIWGAYLNGATLVGIPTEIVLSPHDFAACLRETSVSIMLLSTGLFNLMAREFPSAFNTLRSLVVGGDVMSPHWTHFLLQSGFTGKLINAYGPTECSVVATAYHVTAIDDVAAVVPIGRPIANTEVYVLGEHGERLAVGVPGELYIGGDGVGRGYLHRPELTSARFVRNPFSTDPDARLYRTGDLVQWLPDGLLRFLGRVDNQVKVRGFRVELGEISAALMKNERVRDAVTVVREESPGDKRLISYVILKQASAAGAGPAEGTVRRPILPLTGPDIDAALEALESELEQNLPYYMVPAAVVAIPALPVSANGKLDRSALPPPPSWQPQVAAEAPAGLTPTQEKIAQIWAKLLGTAAVRIHDNFMHVGGNSLLAAQLLLRLHEEFLLPFPTHMFFAKPTIAQIAEHIDTLRLEGFIAFNEMPKLNLRQEGKLDPNIIPAAPLRKSRHAPQGILLTGATGFLGAFMLADLLRSTRAKIYCLVRAVSEEEGMRRILRAQTRYLNKESNAQGRIVVVTGDLTAPQFGLETERFRALAAQIDVIYHSAAHINYVQPYFSHKAANVIGTQEVLRFTCTGHLKQLHYISTVAVFGPIGFFLGTKDVQEDTSIDIAEPYLHYDIGYTQSKWVAEQMVFAARERGVPISIYRPGFIMGHSISGITNTDDFVSRLIVACINLGVFPSLLRQRKEFVAVDYVSQAIIHLSRQPRLLGQNFHLVPRQAEKSVELADFFQTIRQCGYDFSCVDYQAWTNMLAQRELSGAANAMLPLLPMLREKVYKSRFTRWELHESMPRYHCANTIAGLRSSKVKYTPMNRKLVATYLNYFSRLGLIPPPFRSHPAG